MSRETLTEVLGEIRENTTVVLGGSSAGGVGAFNAANFVLDSFDNVCTALSVLCLYCLRCARVIPYGDWCIYGRFLFLLSRLYNNWFGWCAVPVSLSAFDETRILIGIHEHRVVRSAAQLHGYVTRLTWKGGRLCASVAGKKTGIPQAIPCIQTLPNLSDKRRSRMTLRERRPGTGGL